MRGRWSAAGGAAPTLVAAALLHDVGHLLVPDDVTPHETSGAAALAALFGPAVAAPVALHVAAKRYLCLAEAGYQAALSSASKASLIEQGGAFSPAEAAAFAGLPHAAAAIALRRWDDSGKRDNVSVPLFADYLPLLASLLDRRRRPRPRLGPAIANLLV